MGLGAQINRIRKEKGMSVDELCLLSGVPKGTLSKITAEITTNPTIDTVQAIARALGCRLDDFDDSPRSGQTSLVTDDELKHIKKYRSLDDYGQEAVDAVLEVEYQRVQAEEDAKNNIIDYEELLEFVEPVSAGTGIHMDTVGSSKSIRVISNIYTRKADYVLHVSGNSMEPKYHNGDKILVQEVPDVDIGEIGVWMIDGRGYVKQKAEGMLLSLNPEYPPIRPRDTWQQVCQGRVVGLLDPEWILGG